MTKKNHSPSVSPAPTTAGYRAWVLFVLVLIYTFNFLDRQILSILKEPIKADLGLTDTQLGWLGGTAFAMLYATLGIPIARFADRRNRVWIITVALAVWSAFTAVCGMAQNFVQMFFARVGVGAGEAGGVAPAYSLIADYFPPEKRARALSIYSFGIPIGSAIGIVSGGILIDVLGWRMAFVIVGFLGLLLAPLLLLTVREPVRGQYDPPKDPGAAHPSFGDVVRTLTNKPSFWTMSLGAACSSMMGYGLIFWLPSYFYRSFGADLPGFFEWMPQILIPDQASPLLYAGYFFGAILLLGGIVGVWLGGVLGDYLGKDKKGAYAAIPAVAFTLTTPLFFVGVMSDSLSTVFFSFLVIQALALVWLGPVITAFQHLVPPDMRTTASAIFLFINNLIGIAVGTQIMGILSDFFRAEFGDESMRYALLCGIVFYPMAAILLFLTARRLGRDWHGA